MMHMPATTAAVEMPPMPEIPANAKVYFANLKDGQTVTSPLKFEMGVEEFTSGYSKRNIETCIGSSSSSY